VRRLIYFLSRWSAPHGSYGPLIATRRSSHDDYAYLAFRLRFFHWGVWIRVIMRAGARRPRLAGNTFDFRGHPCPCGSGIRIQADVDGCATEGCLERMLDRARARQLARMLAP